MSWRYLFCRTVMTAFPQKFSPLPVFSDFRRFARLPEPLAFPEGYEQVVENSTMSAEMLDEGQRREGRVCPRAGQYRTG